MSTYSITVDWDGKDALADSSAAKVISGDDFQTEFEAVRTAVNSKADLTNSGQDFTCDDAAITGNATITGNTTIGGTLAVTGVPTVPTQTAGNNTTRVATTAFVTTAVAAEAISNADQWRLTTSFTGNVDPISSNLERVDDAGFEKLGSGMAVSSGVWTFPATGVWIVRATWGAEGTDVVDPYMTMQYTSNNGSAWDNQARVYAGSSGGTAVKTTSTGEVMVDITDVSNDKVQFGIVNSSSSATVAGNTDYNFTSFTFMRLGDT